MNLGTLFSATVVISAASTLAVSTFMLTYNANAGQLAPKPASKFPMSKFIVTLSAESQVPPSANQSTNSVTPLSQFAKEQTYYMVVEAPNEIALIAHFEQNQIRMTSVEPLPDCTKGSAQEIMPPAQNPDFYSELLF